MPNSKMRVEIPTNPSDLLDLSTSIYNKHLEDGKDSPFNVLKDFKWETEGPKLKLARAKQTEVEVLEKKLKAAYGERDLIMENTVKIVRASRDLLVGINSNNIKRPGDWGFTVDSSAAPSSKPKNTGTK